MRLLLLFLRWSVEAPHKRACLCKLLCAVQWMPYVREPIYFIKFVSMRCALFQLIQWCGINFLLCFALISTQNKNRRGWSSLSIIWYASMDCFCRLFNFRSRYFWFSYSISFNRVRPNDFAHGKFHLRSDRWHEEDGTTQNPIEASLRYNCCCGANGTVYVVCPIMSLNSLWLSTVQLIFRRRDEEYRLSLWLMSLANPATHWFNSSQPIFYLQDEGTENNIIY